MEFTSIEAFIQSVPDEQTCLQYLEELRWPNGVVSPFDQQSKVYKCKYGYKCRNTGKYFNIKVATIFEDTKIPIRIWLMGLYVYVSLKGKISSYQLAKDIQVTQKSAWFILMRLKYMFNLAKL